MSTLSPRHAQVSEPRRDYVAWAVALGAAVLSVVAFIVTWREGAVLNYKDSISHLEISRRVVAGSNNGLAQLGSVWLPLPHVLTLPFVWIDSLYFSGFAGAIMSMLAFVVATVLVYKIVVRLLARRGVVQSKVAGVAGALVFALNLNVLYMQSTPMTEMLLFATLLGAAYSLLAWADEERLSFLIGSAVWGLLATLTRYESWPIVAVLAASALIIAWRRKEPNMDRRTRGRKLQEVAIVYGAAAFVGVAAWLLWNLVIFGDMFSFYSGEYAKPSLWLTQNEPAIGNFWLSVKTFGYAFIENVPWLLAAVAGFGLVAYLLGERLKSRSLPVLSLLVVAPFMVWAIYTGERPLHVEQVYGDLYNVRFGLIMVLPVAIFIGYLVGLSGRFKIITIVLGVVTVLGAGTLSAFALQNNNVITLREPQEDRPILQEEVARTFGSVYDDGDVLMESFGNEVVGFRSVPSRHHIYEGSNKQERWERSLANPADMGIQWIVMRCTPDYTDKVCRQAREHPEILTGYTLVYEHPDEAAYRIYKRVNN